VGPRRNQFLDYRYIVVYNIMPTDAISLGKPLKTFPNHLFVITFIEMLVCVEDA
jgi:hypothetical protein